MWSTIFVSITVQALPLLALGVTVSGAIAALVPAAFVVAVVVATGVGMAVLQWTGGHRSAGAARGHVDRT